MAKLSQLQRELEDILASDLSKPREQVARDLVVYLDKVAPLGWAYENDLDECMDCNGYPAEGALRCERCQAKPVGYPEDYRLTTLPEEARKLAAEFLDLHRAWDTEFVVYFGFQGAVRLEWDGDNEEASFEASYLNCYEKYRLFFDGGHAAHEVTASLPLRRSADFAEFIQRFRSQSDG